MRDRYGRALSILKYGEASDLNKCLNNVQDHLIARLPCVLYYSLGKAQHYSESHMRACSASEDIEAL